MVTSDWMILGRAMAENVLGCLDLSDLDWRAGLAAVAAMRRRLDRAESLLVTGALNAGQSWAEVGHILQMTGLDTEGRGSRPAE